MSEKCPNCKAERTEARGIWDYWACGSEGCDGVMLKQSDRCRIAELTAKLADITARLESLKRKEADGEEQLVKIASFFGKDARHAPESDRSIAGMAIAEVTELQAKLAAAEAENATLRLAKIQGESV